ncbi:hypothetical protein ILYODFUR_010190 [Ilyodon furcidens]|uniref:MyoD family inhibitor domain-containing protein n=1 Tax=Ilyodon furcidens TaxID=33524 RepID=A0ABV0UGA4_9TELE
MDDKQTFTGMNEDKEKGDKIKSQCLQTTASKLDQTGSLTEVISTSEHISTEDTELPDVSGNVSPNKTRRKTAVEQICLKSGLSTAVYICSPRSVEGHQPKPLHSLLPPFKEINRLPDVSQSFTSTRGQDILKPSSAHTEADGSDLCAAILLDCLFCRPLDCLLETFRGCTMCVWSLCSSMFGCGSDALPILEFTQTWDLCSCCSLCDCTACDICLPATECLDLAMEISQMLYH